MEVRCDFQNQYIILLLLQYYNLADPVIRDCQPALKLVRLVEVIISHFTTQSHVN